MNSSVLSLLPRFDNEGDISAQKKRVEDFALELVAAADDTAGAEPSVSEVEASTLAEVIETPQAASDLLAPEREALNAATSSLTAALLRFETEQKVHICEQVNEIAGELFPKLAHFFLSDEIKAYLPGLIPFNAPAVTIRVPRRLYHQLQDWAATSGELPASCTLESVDNFEQGQVKIVWGQGGYDYDFNSLLAACLDSPHTPSRLNEDLDHERT